MRISPGLPSSLSRCRLVAIWGTADEEMAPPELLAPRLVTRRSGIRNCFLPSWWARSQDRRSSLMIVAVPVAVPLLADNHRSVIH